MTIASTVIHRAIFLCLYTNLELPFDGGRMEGALAGSVGAAGDDAGMGGSDE